METRIGTRCYGRCWLVMRKQPNRTPGKKPPAPSVKIRAGRTPLEQRSGSKPLEPSAKRRSIPRKETGETEPVGAPNRFRRVVVGDRMSADAARRLALQLALSVFHFH